MSCGVAKKGSIFGVFGKRVEISELRRLGARLASRVRGDTMTNPRRGRVAGSQAMEFVG
jgi:hypothetical protein